MFDDRTGASSMSRNLTSAKAVARRKPSRQKATRAPVIDVLELEAVRPDHVAALNAFYRKRQSVDFTFAGQPAEIATAWPVVQTGDQPSCLLRLKLGDHSAELRVPLSLVEKMLATLDKTARLENLPPQHAALLLETVVADELDWLEAKLQVPVELAAIERREPSARTLPFGFALSVGGQRMNCALQVDDGALLARLGSLLDETGSDQTSLPAAFPVPVRLWRDVLSISLGEVRGLRPGDVVLFAEQAVAVLVIGDRLIAPAGMTSSGPQLLAAPVAIAGSKWEWTMGQDTGTSGQAPDDATLEDLPVALAFEVGRRTMPLGEIGQLTAGAIVQLDTPGQAVDILANGRRVGQGEMVRIGESLGVRIIRMFDNA